MSLLCWTRPPQWWDLGDPGNRLALAICRRCPVVTECGVGQEPHEVILGGVAYGEPGCPLPICGTCGYPIAGQRCDHCSVPDVPIPGDRRCVAGHWKTPANTYRQPSHPGKRKCLTCAASGKRRRRRANHPTSRTGAPV